MGQLIVILHVLASMALIGLILIQQGKGAVAGAGFGGGASATVFGSKGSSSFLFKITAAFAAVFFITSLSLGYLAGHHTQQNQGFQIPASLTQSVPTSSNPQSAIPFDIKPASAPSSNKAPSNGASK